MTIGELFRTLEIENQSTEAVYPDGSKQTDHFCMTIMLHGHGNLLNAEVEKFFLNPRLGYIVADGIKGGENP